MEEDKKPNEKKAMTSGQLLPFIISTIIIIFLLMNDPFLAFLYLAFGSLLIIPVAIWAIIVFVKSVKMKTKLEKIAFVWGCVLILLTGLLIYHLLVDHEKPCNPDIMAEYCNEHEQEMRELIAYANQSLEPGKRMELEFEKGKVFRFHVFANDKDSIWSTHWDPVNTDSIMKIVGLDKGEFDNIRQRLKDLECISIEVHTTHEDYATIGFRRVGFGMYSFVIYNRPMTPKEIKKYTEDLMFIPYNDHVVFQFGGGVFGIQTFVPDMKEDFMKRHPVE